MSQPQILGPADLQAINKGLECVVLARQILDKLCGCDVDCQAECQAAAVLEKRLTALRQQFFGVDQ